LNETHNTQHKQLLSSVSSGRARVPRHVEGWFYAVLGWETGPQHGPQWRRSLPLFRIWAKSRTGARETLHIWRGAVGGRHLQWSAICQGGVQDNEAHET